MCTINIATIVHEDGGICAPCLMYLELDRCTADCKILSSNLFGLLVRGMETNESHSHMSFSSSVALTTKICA